MWVFWFFFVFGFFWPGTAVINETLTLGMRHHLAFSSWAYGSWKFPEQTNHPQASWPYMSLRAGSNSRASAHGHPLYRRKMCRRQLPTVHPASHQASQCHQRVFLNETHRICAARLLFPGFCSRWWEPQGDSCLDGQVEVTGHPYQNRALCKRIKSWLNIWCCRISASSPFF